MESNVGKRHVTLILALLLFASVAAAAKPAVPSWRDSHPWSTEVATVRVGTDDLQAEIAQGPELARGVGAPATERPRDHVAQRQVALARAEEVALAEPLDPDRGRHVQTTSASSASACWK